ncbi:TBC1 domain family member 22B-like, partial [Phalaenopsis equestris]|uniref:TBC1 domain family member 22B-like n=1 Tax=Phalaenopsis equestris TaxID=78828 RepID=UPI0009E3BBD2
MAILRIEGATLRMELVEAEASCDPCCSARAGIAANQTAQRSLLFSFLTVVKGAYFALEVCDTCFKFGAALPFMLFFFLFFLHHLRYDLSKICFRAIRHPASGYVQGINDLVTPFLVVFLEEHLDGNMESWDISHLSPQTISNIEADCYWCLSKLLDGMQDHYTFAQPGIQRLVFKLKELVRRIDEPVSRHMDEQGLEFLQFAFRWFNCLLIREIPFHLVTRLWDTYLAEGDSLPEFLVYISASFLLT